MISLRKTCEDVLAQAAELTRDCWSLTRGSCSSRRYRRRLLATRQARTFFAPHVDTGDYVIIVNADKMSSRPTNPPRTFTTALGYPAVCGHLVQTLMDTNPRSS